MKASRFKYFILLLVLSHSVFTHGQVKHITLVIDTLITNNKRFYIAQTEANFTAFPLEVEREKILIDTVNHPNLIYVLSLINDSAKIWLSVDSKGGYLELINLYSLQIDTIRINKFEVLNNCIPDTTFTSETQWNETDDGITNPPIKYEFKADASAKTCNDPVIESIGLIINGINYTCMLIVQEEGIHYELSHGRIPKKKKNRSQKRPFNYEGKKRIYFSGRVVRSQFRFISVLEIR